jgi:hypothetical protein
LTNSSSSSPVPVLTGTGGGPPAEQLFGRLNFIDLAGSERKVQNNTASDSVLKVCGVFFLFLFVLVIAVVAVVVARADRSHVFLLHDFFLSLSSSLSFFL